MSARDSIGRHDHSGSISGSIDSASAGDSSHHHDGSQSIEEMTVERESTKKHMDIVGPESGTTSRRCSQESNESDTKKGDGVTRIGHKDMNVHMAVPPQGRVRLNRVLSWWSLTSMGVGATIGAGIFVLTGLVAHTLTGPALTISFIIAAIVCVFAGLCYAEFSALAPSAGSAYAYTRATMGQMLAFCIGWDLILEYTVAAAAVAQSWSQYLNEFLGLFSAKIPTIISTPPFAYDGSTSTVSATGAIIDLPALIISLVITALLVCGVRDSARFNNAMVALKVGICLFVIGLGAALVDTNNFTPFAPFGWLGLSFFGHNVSSSATSKEGQAAGVLAGSAIVFFSYIGFDAVSCQAEEAKTPERDVPIAIILSLTVSTMLYVGVAIVLTGMINYTLIDVNAPLSAAFAQRGYHWAAYLIAIGAVVGITSVLLVTMLSQPRIFMAMARDGLLPKFFEEIHPRFHTPWKATILTGSAVALISSLIPLSILAEFVSIGTLCAFAFTCVAVLILRRTKPDLPRPFRCPCSPVVPILGVLLCLLLMFSLPANNWYRLIAWWAIGMVVYYFYGRKHGVGEKHQMQTRSVLDGKDDAAHADRIELTQPRRDSNTTLGGMFQADQEMNRTENRPRSHTDSMLVRPIQVFGRNSVEHKFEVVEDGKRKDHLYDQADELVNVHQSPGHSPIHTPLQSPTNEQSQQQAQLQPQKRKFHTAVISPPGPRTMPAPVIVYHYDLDDHDPPHALHGATL